MLVRPTIQRLACQKPTIKGVVEMVLDGVHGFYPVCDGNDQVIYFTSERKAMKAAQKYANEVLEDARVRR